MDAINNILTRYSVREFSNQAVEDEKVDLIVKCAFSAPSAVNRQPWNFIVINQPEIK